MSDLYLDLRARIPIVAARTHLGKQRIEEYQQAVGLSNEAVARKIPVSEKTWRRWKEKGEIPTAVLPAVASALRMDIREMHDGNGGSPEGGATYDLQDLRETLDEVRDDVRDLAAVVAALSQRLLENLDQR